MSLRLAARAAARSSSRIVGAGRPTLQQWLDGAKPVPDPDDLVDAIAEVLPAHGPLADMNDSERPTCAAARWR
ncbi:hypothetical protein [Nonomuraea aurantiaca]|uniref:hypothetical protein n=1 Tax=Nonomuraea aurantiaca TaxID=2878562 RepID=UPI001CD9C277|nr:hypothetical protein [Nonomuraea aurantiaca]MCA2224978.1 hypothetical protein [Nonomuraea aurantiaca]